MAAYRKAIVAVLAFAANAVAQGLIAGDAAKWVSVVLSALAVAGVYTARNEPVAGE